MGLWCHPAGKTHRQTVRETFRVHESVVATNGARETNNFARWNKLLVNNRRETEKCYQQYQVECLLWSFQAACLARHDDHDSFWSAEDAQLRRVHFAELADGDRGQLPLDQYVPQFDPRRWCPPVDSLLSAAQSHQSPTRPVRHNRLPHRCSYSRRGSPRENQVGQFRKCWLKCSRITTGKSNKLANYPRPPIAISKV